MTWSGMATGSAVERGLIPPFKPALELHIRDVVVTLGWGRQLLYDRIYRGIIYGLGLKVLNSGNPLIFMNGNIWDSYGI